ncbi:MAG: right-handed parallel beta-helix repeat-containing protein [Acidimicrobiia bacterium]|jgi:parallel beta-helix repeat protein|nr:right-handed parallel beta-helix repeat-containing protein [Acidimicrobiia bacterium]
MRTSKKAVTGALVASGMVVGGLALASGSATAEHNSNEPCMVVTADMTLTGDVGPCDGHGIIIQADNVTLDLAGFTVSGDNVEMEQVGVLFDGVSGSTVTNGTVTGFDAGVSIEGGSGNTVSGLTVEDNVNDMIETIDPRSIIIAPGTMPTPEQMQQIEAVTCNYGDGITTLDSSDNMIMGNTVTGNGPYSGISLVGDSNGNMVSGNEVHENDLLNNGVMDGAGNPVFVDGVVGSPTRGRHVPAGTPGAVQPQSMCGATEVGTPGMGRGREVQSIGIRVEGPGADENVVDSNTVTKGGLAGISIHSYVLVPAAPNVPVGSSSSNNVVSNNSVSRTGEDTNEADSFADGIASLSSGPVGTVTRPSDSNTFVGNTSFDNFRHGISLGRLSHSNTVDDNMVMNNGGSGIWVAGPGGAPGTDQRGAYDNNLSGNEGSGNGEFDGTDLNPSCDNNAWVANVFGTVNQPCVAGLEAEAPGTPVVETLAGWHAATVSFDAVADGSTPVTSYRVTLFDGDTEVETITVPADGDLSATFGDLETGTTYTASVVAVSLSGDSAAGTAMVTPIMAMTADALDIVGRACPDGDSITWTVTNLLDIPVGFNWFARTAGASGMGAVAAGASVEVETDFVGPNRNTFRLVVHQMMQDREQSLRPGAC